MRGCDHDGGLMLRTITPREGRWRRLCGCCAEFIHMFLTLDGYTVEVVRADEVRPDAVTFADVEAAHAALKGDVKIGDLIGQKG